MRKTRESSSSSFEEKLFLDFKNIYYIINLNAQKPFKLWEDQITALDKQDE